MTDQTLLLIEDDPSIQRTLGRLFIRLGWNVLQAETGEVGLELCNRDQVHVVLQDLELAGLDGIDLLRALIEQNPDAPVVILTGTGDIESAVAAIQAGAEDFLTKPPDLKHLASVMDAAGRKWELRRQNRTRSSGVAPEFENDRLQSLLDSPALRDLAERIESVAGTESTVLLGGETGTGKNWVARLIHSLSDRADGRMVEVNCASLTTTLLESELFGHERGAFTDARTRKDGLFMAADGGTLFLDEVAELKPDLQPKLLTAIESGRIRRLGGTDEIEVDVRIIAASNRSLDKEVEEGRFREDLYYRLAVFPLHIPPLRERGSEQITNLAYDLLRELAPRVGQGQERISTIALERLVAYPWPGNIRELRNVLEGALINARGADEIRPHHLPAALQEPHAATRGKGYDVTLTQEAVEKHHILRVLDFYQGNRSQAARSLGIGRRTLYDKLERYGLD